MFENMDKLYLAIILFVSLYMILNTVQPNFIFNHELNCLRQFGIGYKNTTVITLWLATILLAILSYFTVIYVYYIRNMWY